MLVTLSGIVMLVSPLQPEKAELPMLVTLSGIVTLVSPVQPEKASAPILVTLSGMATTEDLPLYFFKPPFTILKSFGSYSGWRISSF